MSLWQVKLRAFLVHLLFSAVIISLFLLVITQLWFPGILFQLENVWEGLKILIPVDAILGPLLTFILFVPGKKGLKMDLTIIGIFQIGALIAGGYLIYLQRPAAITFVMDRFEIVPHTADYIVDIPKERFNQESPILLTYALPPQSSLEKTQFIMDGIQFNKIGERHYPLNQYMKKVAEKSLDIDKIKPKSEVSKQRLAEFKKQFPNMDNLILLPLQASTSDSIMLVIESTTGKIKHYLEIDPWTEYVKTPE